MKHGKLTTVKLFMETSMAMTLTTFDFLYYFPFLNYKVFSFQLHLPILGGNEKLLKNQKKMKIKQK